MHPRASFVYLFSSNGPAYAFHHHTCAMSALCVSVQTGLPVCFIIAKDVYVCNECVVCVCAASVFHDSERCIRVQ